MKYLIVCSMLLVSLGTNATNLDSLYQDDVSSIEKLCDAMLSAFSGKADEQKDWKRFENLFLPGATQLDIVGGDEPELNVLTMEDFMEGEKPWYDETNFSEWTIKYTIRQFGDMASVIQPFGYEYFNAGDLDEDEGVGYTAFQLVNKDGRWWIVSLL